MNYFPYITVFLFAVFGIWGLMAFDNDSDRVADQPRDAAYVEQTLEPKATALATGAPMQPTRTRVAEDEARDRMMAVRRHEIANDANRIDDYAATETYDDSDDVASVDLSDPSGPPQLTSPTEAAAPDQPTVAASPEVAVVDLDYSDRPTVALSDQDLRNALGQLEVQVERTEVMAEETGQVASHEVLEERFDLLEDLVEARTAPINEPDRLNLTRQLNELRDEVSAFSEELEGLKKK